MSKKFSKHISFFDYLDKSLIVLSVTSDGVSIASFATAIGNEQLAEELHQPVIRKFKRR